MPQLNRLPTIPHVILQPACPKCSEPMELARTTPFKAYDEIEDRIYQCPKCGHEEEWVVKEL
jgi:DNA-directed RNA polymerase subunit M/transcription elongation factor TFIIS